MSVPIVILAGGEGRRMGGGKPLRMLGGRSLIDRAIEQAQRSSNLVAVSVRQPGQAGPIKVPEIEDDAGEGPLAGLASALRFAKTAGAQAVVTIPCDMPLLPANLVSRLQDALPPGSGAAIAASGGELHPVCALWRCTAADALPPYRAAGRASLKGLASEVGYSEVEWPVEPFDPFLNINRPEELRAAGELLSLLRNR